MRLRFSAACLVAAIGVSGAVLPAQAQVAPKQTPQITERSSQASLDSAKRDTIDGKVEDASARHRRRLDCDYERLALPEFSEVFRVRAEPHGHPAPGEAPKRRSDKRRIAREAPKLACGPERPPLPDPEPENGKPPR